MSISPVALFWQWLIQREAELTKELETANSHSRMLIKTERAELAIVMNNYSRMVMNSAVTGSVAADKAPKPVHSKEFANAGNEEPLEFTLSPEATDAIALGIRALRFILADQKVMPSKIVAAANALYALQRMPLSTTGVKCEFQVNDRAGDEDFSELRYIGFHITEDAFDISIGGSVYDKSVGSDNYSNEGWRMELGDGGRHAELIREIEREVDEFIALGASFSISDESEMEFED